MLLSEKSEKPCVGFTDESIEIIIKKSFDDYSAL